MSEFLFSGWSNNESGPVAVLREFVQWLIKVTGPLLDVLRPLWERVVAFLREMHQQLSEQYEQDQDRATWGRPELGWDS